MRRGRPYQRAAVCYASENSIATPSEVKLKHNLRKPRVQDLLWLLPAVVRGVHGEHGVRIERVVDVETRVEPCTAKTQNLADTQIELIEAFTVHRSGFDDIHLDIARAARKRAPERRADFVGGCEVSGQNFGPRQILKRR